jgi:hypothetical protein
MATYDNPLRINYPLGSVTVSTSDATKSIKGPAGHKGRVVLVSAGVTTTTAGSTSTPRVQVGRSGALTRYADMDVGAVTAPEMVSAGEASASLTKDSYRLQSEIAADEEVLVTLKAAVGSGAGVIEPSVTIEWFK